MSGWQSTELGFDGRNMQVIRVASNPEWGDVINVNTPTGTVQIYVSPKGQRTRIFWGSKELTK
jgi:hypothetical protein